MRFSQLPIYHFYYTMDRDVFQVDINSLTWLFILSFEIASQDTAFNLWMSSAKNFFADIRQIYQDKWQVKVD